MVGSRVGVISVECRLIFLFWSFFVDLGWNSVVEFHAFCSWKSSCVLPPTQIHCVTFFTNCVVRKKKKARSVSASTLPRPLRAGRSRNSWSADWSEAGLITLSCCVNVCSVVLSVALQSDVLVGRLPPSWRGSVTLSMSIRCSLRRDDALPSRQGVTPACGSAAFVAHLNRTHVFFFCAHVACLCWLWSHVAHWFPVSQ